MALRPFLRVVRRWRKSFMFAAILLCLTSSLLIYFSQRGPISHASVVLVSHRADPWMANISKTLTPAQLPTQRNHHDDISNTGHEHHDGISNTGHEHHSDISNTGHEHHDGISNTGHEHHDDISNTGHEHHDDISNTGHEHHDDISNTGHEHHEDTTTHDNTTQHECTFPFSDPFDPAVLAIAVFHPPISCETGVPHLVYVTGDVIKVNHSKTALVGDGNNKFTGCRYRSMDRQPGSDVKTVSLYNSSSFNDSITLRDNDDNLVVECYGSNNTVLSRSYFSLIRVKKDLEHKLEQNLHEHIAKVSPKEVLSVLMISMDGNSKQNLQRHMPKTRNYLLHGLNALELHKYNKAGEGTLENLMPLLTGRLELTRPNWTTSEYFDYINHEMLWSKFHKAGYRTGVFFDESFVTPFHFYKKGWNKSPVDYYHRATILELEKDQLMKERGVHCVGDVPEITFNHNYWIQLASTFNNSQSQPYFGFSHSTRLTHDEHNMASAGDDLYLRFLLELKEKNIINNTIIIFFSDHGSRIGELRSTYNGMIETMTPYVFLIFPPWFHRKYPDLIRVLKINQERLTTNTDLHATLLDILNFQGKSGIGDITQQGISLFNEIPRERTCKDARIPVEYCLCNKLTKGNVSASMEFVLAQSLKNHVVWLTEGIRGQCVAYRLGSVQNVMEIQTGNSLEDQKFSMYQITLTTQPGGAIFEAKYVVDKVSQKVWLRGDILRLNLYRGQADCLHDAKLKPYCYCTNI